MLKDKENERDFMTPAAMVVTTDRVAEARSGHLAIQFLKRRFELLKNDVDQCIGPTVATAYGLK